jgi:hypothetical protein
MTAAWPSGLAYIVVDELFKKYRPVDIMSRVEMRTKLNHVSMKIDDDPRVMFDQLASIQSAYNDATRKIDPDDLIAVVLEKAPEHYKSILTAEQRSKGTSLTLHDLSSCMNDLYRARSPNKISNKTDVEMSLVAPTTKFQGICGYCKKPGHMARDCRKKKAEQTKEAGSTSLRPCKHCGGKHMDYKCWELPQNAKNRPVNWKTKKGNETASVAHDGRTDPNVELLLCNIEDELQSFTSNEQLLRNPNIWIGDTAATMHMTPYEEGMINCKKSRGGITVGNGEVMVASCSGDIPCETCDRHGKTLTAATITEVALTKNAPFNLLA